MKQKQTTTKIKRQILLGTAQYVTQFVLNYKKRCVLKCKFYVKSYKVFLVEKVWNRI